MAVVRCQPAPQSLTEETMTDDTPKQETGHRNDDTPETAAENDADVPRLFYEERDGKYHALLPSGKRPEIRPVRPPGKLRDIMAAHPRPQVPLVEIQPEGVSIAQRFPNPKDPTYLARELQWRKKYMMAMMMRCLFDGLVVPEDDEWAWLLVMEEVPVPQDGPERVRLYAQEKHPEFWDQEKPDEAASFVAAVQQITMPSEAGIAIARLRFRPDVAEDTVGESEVAAGGIPGQPRGGRIEGGQGIQPDAE